ncbi:MAG: HAMP domain-containing protein [Deltaproteobacteria bacterium]|nr:HAMP domain-containing protein [Deltaproteobacteria bacterium]
MRRHGFQLRGRLLFLVCFATLPAILFTFFVAENERANALIRTEREALHMAGLVSREHSHQIRGARELLEWLGVKLAREGLQSPIVTDRGFLRALLAGHPQLANIGVLAPDGRVLASAYPLPSYRSWSDNPAYLAALRSDKVVSGVYMISPIFERPTLNHAVAVRNEVGEVIAVLFDGLDLEWLSDMVRQSGLPEGSALFIVDREGQVIAHGGQVPDGEAAAQNLRIPDIARLAASQHARLLDIGDGSHRYLVAASLEGAEGLSVAASLPYDRLLRQANLTFYRTIIVLTVLTLFIIIATFVTAEIGFLRNIRALARVAQRFGSGDLSARANASLKQNEFTLLARTFNAMADSLALRHLESVETQARLRTLANQLQVAREAEAARISRELHDEIGQVLTSLKIELSRLPISCAMGKHEEGCAASLDEGVAMMIGQIEMAMDAVRRISSHLRPGVLDKLGLVAAMEWQARELEARTGLAVQVEADVVDGLLDETLSVTLFRIAQEALTNVVRHAQAKVVEVCLEKSGECIILTVRDDGKGITGEAAESGHSLGIIGMRERAMLINGTLSIHGEPGQGTTVRVVVPLSRVSEGLHAYPAR